MSDYKYIICFWVCVMGMCMCIKGTISRQLVDLSGPLVDHWWTNAYVYACSCYIEIYIGRRMVHVCIRVAYVHVRVYIHANSRYLS